MGRIIFTILNSFNLRFHRSLLAFLAFCITLTSFAHFAFPSYALPYVIAGQGFFFGASWSLAPSAVLFLPESHLFSMVWAWLALGIGAGPLTIGQVVGTLYDNQTAVGDNNCLGEQCFKDSTLFMGCLADLHSAGNNSVVEGPEYQI